MSEVQENPTTQLGTAALPSAVLAAITDCTDLCRTTLRRLQDEREHLRTLLDRRIRPAPDGPVRRLCAVDGSHASVPTAGATFAAVAAAAVEDAALTDQEVLVHLLPPIEEAEMILGGVRCILELRLLARRIRATDSGLFILDGSFYSMLLEINRLLIRYAQDHHGGRPPAWWDVFRSFIDAFFVSEDWRLVLECRRVIAHSKSATSADDVTTLAPHLSGTVTDRSLWSNVLYAGEYALPVSLIRKDRPHLLTGYRSPALASFHEHRTTIEHAYGQRYVVYYRPDTVGPAYRLELPAALIAREPLERYWQRFAVPCASRTFRSRCHSFLPMPSAASFTTHWQQQQRGRAPRCGRSLILRSSSTIWGHTEHHARLVFVLFSVLSSRWKLRRLYVFWQHTIRNPGIPGEAT